MFGRKTRWSGVPGEYSVECGQAMDTGEWMTFQPEKPLPPVVVGEIKRLFPRWFFVRWWAWIISWFDFTIIDDRPFEITLHWRSSGYYDPGRTYGDPYYCYPPEGEDERTLEYGEVEMWIGRGNVKRKKLSKAAAQAVFDLFVEEIHEEQLEYDPDDR
jgi:hypothetical protein